MAPTLHPKPAFSMETSLIEHTGRSGRPSRRLAPSVASAPGVKPFRGDFARRTVAGAARIRWRPMTLSFCFPFNCEGKNTITGINGSDSRMRRVRIVRSVKRLAGGDVSIPVRLDCCNSLLKSATQVPKARDTVTRPVHEGCPQ